MRADQVARTGKALLIGLGAGAMLAGCAMQSAESGTSAPAASAAPVHATSLVHPGAIRTGAQTQGMAAQYASPRLGPVAATGAGAWVPPAPPPAFVLKEVPPPAPPTPLPAAVANRQPARAAPASSAVDASQIARPEAAAQATPAPALSAATRQQGRELFAAYSCSSCHALADADAHGSICPALDGNPGLTKAYVIEVLNEGRGAMPSVAGQMTDQEIATLADYILGAARK
jgi:mono/diheme cytochrome c family protein